MAICSSKCLSPTSPASVNITPLLGDLINAASFRCIAMFTPRHPSVCTNMFKATVSVSISLSHRCNISLFFSKVLLSTCFQLFSKCRKTLFYHIIFMGLSSFPRNNLSLAHVQAGKSPQFGETIFSHETVHTVLYVTCALLKFSSPTLRMQNLEKTGQRFWCPLRAKEA